MVDRTMQIFIWWSNVIFNCTFHVFIHLLKCWGKLDNSIEYGVLNLYFWLSQGWSGCFNFFFSGSSLSFPLLEAILFQKLVLTVWVISRRWYCGVSNVPKVFFFPCLSEHISNHRQKLFPALCWILWIPIL